MYHNIHGNVVGDSKAIDDVKEELERLDACDHDDRLSLDPLGELVDRNEKMRPAPGCLI